MLSPVAGSRSRPARPRPRRLRAAHTYAKKASHPRLVNTPSSRSGHSPEPTSAERAAAGRILRDVTPLELLVRKLFAAFAARDVTAVIAVCDPDVEFLPVTASPGGSGLPYRGHDGIERYFVDVARWWDRLEIEPVEFREFAPEAMLVIGRVRASRRGTEIDSSAGWVWRFRGGRLVSGRVYESAEAAEQAIR
jgi:ketosteroid isomerase-like protein